MWNENKSDNQQNPGELNLDSLQNSGDFSVNWNDPSMIWLNKQDASSWSYVNLDMIDQDIEQIGPEQGKIVLGDDWMKADMTRIVVNHSYWRLFILSFFCIRSFSSFV